MSSPLYDVNNITYMNTATIEQEKVGDIPIWLYNDGTSASTIHAFLNKAKSIEISNFSATWYYIGNMTINGATKRMYQTELKFVVRTITYADNTNSWMSIVFNLDPSLPTVINYQQYGSCGCRYVENSTTNLNVEEVRIYESGPKCLQIVLKAQAAAGFPVILSYIGYL